LVGKLQDESSEAMTPGRYLVESLPILRKLPRFLQPWRDELERIGIFEREFTLKSFDEALKTAEMYPERPCVARDIHREIVSTGIVNHLQGAMTAMETLGAGGDTTAYSLVNLIQGCLTNPEAVKKAHEELDRVIGQDRYPTWADEPDLPYIRAMIKEQQRWRTIAPVGTGYLF
jgi:hypothetical protein